MSVPSTNTDLTKRSRNPTPAAAEAQALKKAKADKASKGTAATTLAEKEKATAEADESQAIEVAAEEDDADKQAADEAEEVSTTKKRKAAKKKTEKKEKKACLALGNAVQEAVGASTNDGDLRFATEVEFKGGKLVKPVALRVGLVVHVDMPDNKQAVIPVVIGVIHRRYNAACFRAIFFQLGEDNSLTHGFSAHLATVRAVAPVQGGYDATALANRAALAKANLVAAAAPKPPPVPRAKQAHTGSSTAPAPEHAAAVRAADLSGIISQATGAVTDLQALVADVHEVLTDAKDVLALLKDKERAVFDVVLAMASSATRGPH